MVGPARNCPERKISNSRRTLTLRVPISLNDRASFVSFRIRPFRTASDRLMKDYGLDIFTLYSNVDRQRRLEMPQNPWKIRTVLKSHRRLFVGCTTIGRRFGQPRRLILESTRNLSMT